MMLGPSNFLGKLSTGGVDEKRTGDDFFSVCMGNSFGLLNDYPM